jgi:hypothetical protein
VEVLGLEQAGPLPTDPRSKVMSVSSRDNPFTAADKAEKDKGGSRQHNFKGLYGVITSAQKLQWGQLTKEERKWLDANVAPEEAAKTFKGCSLQEWIKQHPVKLTPVEKKSGSQHSHTGITKDELTAALSNVLGTPGPSASNLGSASGSYVSKDDLYESVCPILESRTAWIQHAGMLKMQNDTLRCLMGSASDPQMQAFATALPKVPDKEDDSHLIPPEFRFGHKKQKVW